MPLSPALLTTDVVGVLKDIAEPTEITSKTTQKSVSRLYIP